MAVPHFDYPVYGYLGCFHLVAVVKNATMNMSVQISVGVPVFNNFQYISRSRVIEFFLIFFIFSFYGMHYFYYLGPLKPVRDFHEKTLNIPLKYSSEIFL